jgi:hypothetical protein
MEETGAAGPLRRSEGFSRIQCVITPPTSEFLLTAGSAGVRISRRESRRSAADGHRKESEFRGGRFIEKQRRKQDATGDVSFSGRIAERCRRAACSGGPVGSSGPSCGGHRRRPARRCSIAISESARSTDAPKPFRADFSRASSCRRLPYRSPWDSRSGRCYRRATAARSDPPSPTWHARRRTRSHYRSCGS